MRFIRHMYIGNGWTARWKAGFSADLRKGLEIGTESGLYYQ